MLNVEVFENYNKDCFIFLRQIRNDVIARKARPKQSIKRKQLK